MFLMFEWYEETRTARPGPNLRTRNIKGEIFGPAKQVWAPHGGLRWIPGNAFRSAPVPPQAKTSQSIMKSYTELHVFLFPSQEIATEGLHVQQQAKN